MFSNCKLQMRGSKVWSQYTVISQDLTWSPNVMLKLFKWWLSLYNILSTLSIHKEWNTLLFTCFFCASITSFCRQIVNFDLKINKRIKMALNQSPEWWCSSIWLWIWNQNLGKFDQEWEWRSKQYKWNSLLV